MRVLQDMPSRRSLVWGQAAGDRDKCKGVTIAVPCKLYTLDRPVIHPGTLCMSEDIELGALGGKGGTNPLHSGSSYRRRPSVLKRSSFSTAHSKTLESSALAIDSWLFENALAVGDEAGGAEGKAEAEREDRDRGLVRHCVDGSSAVFFISDWQKLWNHFSADPADTFGDSFTFYRDTCYLLCHFQTLRLVCYTVLYSCTIGVVCSIIYPPFSSVLIYLLVINPVFFSLLYLWAYFLYRGPMLSRETVAPNVLAPSQVGSRHSTITYDAIHYKPMSRNVWMIRPSVRRVLRLIEGHTAHRW